MGIIRIRANIDFDEVGEVPSSLWEFPVPMNMGGDTIRVRGVVI